jgi:LPXTG-site transpeptidase (sortase) family protein
MKRIHKSISIFILLALLLVTTNALAAPGDTTLVSVDSSGAQGGDDSDEPSISSDGRYVAFESGSSLVSGDTNLQTDIFVHDRNTNTTTRISVASSGTQGDGDSYEPSISSDGRYVAFNSNASNLVSGDTNGDSDIFVHDRNTGITTCVSVNSSGVFVEGVSYNPSISSDGRYVAFNSNAKNLVSGDTNWQTDVFVHDRDTNTITRVSMDSSGMQGNGGSTDPSISSDGRYVAFVSSASNLVSGDTNWRQDIFVHDRNTNTTTRVSVASSGTQGDGGSFAPAISSDGRYVAFVSNAGNLVSGDTNGNPDIFVYDNSANTTTRVSVDSSGTQGDGVSAIPSISSSGRYVAFLSTSSNLVSGDTNGEADTFVHDRNTNTTTRVSVDSSGTQGNSFSHISSISSSGRYVAFGSYASNLVSGDTNGAEDIFVHEQYVANPPFVTSTSLAASYTGAGPASFIVTFNENVNNAGGGADPDDAANPANYRVIKKGANGLVDTGSCADPLAGDDTQIKASGVVYTPNTAVITFASSLPVGKYRLSVCGTTSIVDLAGNPLNGGVDYTFDFEVLSESGSGNSTLPRTGFAPNMVTFLPSQPAELAYTKMSDLWLEIPSQKVKANIVGVPQSDNAWDVKWLGQDAGWLNGTAFPSWEGNSVITAHVMGADGLPGPFAKLKDLNYGEQVIVHLLGQQYVFEVRNTRLVRPETTAFAFEHLEDHSYLTLITCAGYNEEGNSYSFRRVVRAVLVDVR